MNQTRLSALTAMLLFSVTAFTQSFTLSTDLLGDAFHSGGPIGFIDVDNDGLDDLVLFDQGDDVNILYQTATGFSKVHYGQVSTANQWGACIGDMNNDGFKDIYAGGSYDGVHFMAIGPGGTFELNDLDNGSMFMQACNMADLDNDGVLDAFGCHDDALSRMWKGSETGPPVNDQNLMPLMSYDHTDYPNTDHSGNYGTVFSDFDSDGDVDLYIAKCRQFVSDPQDPRRINQLWVNDGQGGWTEEAADRGLVFFEQSWTADFGDIDNDGDMDLAVTNHSTTLFLLENDGTGHYTDITAGSGMEVSGFFLQSKFEDFDNDGFLDFITSGDNSSNYYFKGNGDGTFEQLAWPFSYGDAMLSFATGDVSRDGQMDLIASHGSVYVSPDNNNPDQLYINDGSDHHWVCFDLQGIESNADAVGAQVAIYGPWGVQLRDVRAGESYGITCTTHPHFGLGEADHIDSAVVHFPSGFTTTLIDPAIDTYHNVIEAPCQIGAFDLTLTGANVICPGETVTIDAPMGYATYEWSNGEMALGITVGETGNYTVLVYDQDGCAGISNPISIEVYEPEVPTITVDGDLKLCDGETVTLICSAAPGYAWSNGATDQSIQISEAGTYSVAIDGECAEPTASENVVVEVYDVPGNPTVEDTEIPAPASTTLEFTGSELHWYDSETAENPVFVGNSYTTDVLSETTTFWVEDVLNHGLETAMGGSSAQSDGQYHNNSNYWLRFDAYEDLVIESVKVFANGEEDRTIAAIDGAGNVLDQITVTIPDGESIVELGLVVPAGTGHGLRSLDGNPQLWRDGQGSNLDYPYELGDLATITSSSVNNPNNATNYYYFFYDWTVSTQGIACASDRVPVTVTVTTSGVADLTVLDGGLQVYPNPTEGQVQLQWEVATGAVRCEVIDASGRLLFQREAAGPNLLGTLDFSTLPKGVHILKLTQGGRTATARIVLR
jgi:hypothetical protein